MKSLKRTFLAALGLAAFTTACADSPMAPEADLPLAAAFVGRPGGGTDGDSQGAGSSVLQWITPLAQDITVSETCYSGVPCVLSIDEVDAQLTVPNNALSATTVITMTALAGADVNFVFGPHGIQFNMPVKIKVGQRKTNGKGQDFTALYWVENLEDVQEEISAKVKNGWIEFETNHFSGYAIAM